MFNAIWEFFNGKKTAIGMVLVLIAMVGRYLYPAGDGVWVWFENTGYGLGAAGVLHKGVKATGVSE